MDPLPIAELRQPYTYTVYGCIGVDGIALYVGFTRKGFGRLSTHAGTRVWWEQVADIGLWHYETESEARAAETALIARWRPLFNKLERPVGPPAVLRRPSREIEEAA